MDPDVRYALYEVKKSYARLGNKEMSELLLDLLVKRTLIKEHTFETLVLNVALATVPKLTLEQINILYIYYKLL